MFKIKKIYYNSLVFINPSLKFIILDEVWSMFAKCLPKICYIICDNKNTKTDTNPSPESCRRFAEDLPQKDALKKTSIVRKQESFVASDSSLRTISSNLHIFDRWWMQTPTNIRPLYHLQTRKFGPGKCSPGCCK